ncbi:MAG: outer membrane beta-barrel protein [Planctomycetaceae bacterium]|nr:outer membrane beta-barrel protein [Planctomycetaceae bacterium]
MKRSVKTWSTMLALSSLAVLADQSQAWQSSAFSLSDETSAVEIVQPAQRVPVRAAAWQESDDPSRLQVPAAPQVDQSANPSARPLTVPSNAATQPDDFYRSSWCNLGEPVRLVDRPDIGLRIGGWQQVGFHSRNDGLFNNLEDRAAFHQTWGFVEKEFVTQRGWEVTMRGDIVYGLDAQQFQAFGNEPFGAATGWDNDLDNGIYGWALPQAYADVKFDNLKLRTGRFLSPFGFETGAAVENFFYSRTFAFTRTQPHSLTGAIADYSVDDTTSVFLGGTNGWDTSFDRVDMAGLAGFSRQINGRSFFNFGSSFGEFGQRGNGYYQSALYAVQATDKLQLALQSDWLSADLSDDYGFIGYAIYRINPCLALGSRYEYWETDPAAGTRQSANSLTGGLNFRPHANIVVRPEARYDWNTAATARDAVNVGLDFVVTF